MPVLRGSHRSTPEEVAEAQKLRRAGESYQAIGAALGRSTDWARLKTRHIIPKDPPMLRGMQLPTDPILRRRIMNLAKRGFDVPPSKQADWAILTSKHFPVEERKRILNLE